MTDFGENLGSAHNSNCNTKQCYLANRECNFSTIINFGLHLSCYFCASFTFLVNDPHAAFFGGKGEGGDAEWRSPSGHTLPLNTHCMKKESLAMGPIRFLYWSFQA